MWQFLKKLNIGVLAVAQWFKNPTAVALFAAVVQVGLKDLVLLQLWHRSQLWLRFNPWPGNCHVDATDAPLRKRKKMSKRQNQQESAGF